MTLADNMTLFGMQNPFARLCGDPGEDNRIIQHSMSATKRLFGASAPNFMEARKTEGSVSISFDPSVLDIVEVETLLFLQSLTALFQPVKDCSIEYLVVPKMLSPASFMGTGNYLKKDDLRAALKRAGWDMHFHNMNNDGYRYILPVYLPKEASARTPERRIHLASRTAAKVGSHRVSASLSTPDDYLVWQVCVHLQQLSGVYLVNNHLPSRLMYNTNGETPSTTTASRIGVSGLMAPLDDLSVAAWLPNGPWSTMLPTMSKDADLLKQVSAYMHDEARVGLIFKRAAEDYRKPEWRGRVLDDLRRGLAEYEASTGGGHFEESIVRLTQCIEGFLGFIPRALAAAREAYDPDGTIEGLSILWAEGKTHPRFS